jgi:hypothetical protein
LKFEVWCIIIGKYTVCKTWVTLHTIRTNDLVDVLVLMIFDLEVRAFTVDLFVRLLILINEDKMWTVTATAQEVQCNKTWKWSVKL